MGKAKKCIKGCGRETEAKSGICVICQMFPERDITAHENLLPARKEPSEVPRKKYAKNCEHEGCEKNQWKERLCMVHYKQKHGIPVGRKGRRNVNDDPPPPIPIQSTIKPIDTSRPIKPQLEQYRQAEEGKGNVSNLTLVDISVDLELYPALRKWLLDGIDVIDTVQLLSVLIKPRLDELNSKIEKSMEQSEKLKWND